MAFTLEDGSGVTNANTYISLQDARSFVVDRGLSLPLDDAECQQALVRGADYVDRTYGHCFQGRTVSSDQAMSWPRYGAYLDGHRLSYDSVPSLVQAAQIHAAVAIAAGTELEPTGNAAPVRREKVGSLETEYHTSAGRGSLTPRITSVERLVRPLLLGGGRAMVVRA